MAKTKADNRPTITYHYRGQVERPKKANGKPIAAYTWREGFSPDGDDGSPQFPWMTRQECRQEAKARGARAVFKPETTREVWTRQR